MLMMALCGAITTSEPGVVGSGCGWLDGARILPELYNVEEYLSSHLSAPLPFKTFKRRHIVHEIHLLEKASGSGAIVGSNGGGLPHLGQPVWHLKVLRLRYFGSRLSPSVAHFIFFFQ